MPDSRARRAARGRRARRPDRVDLHRRVCAGRRRRARRPAGDDPLARDGTARAALPRDPGGAGCPLRRRRAGADIGRRRRRHRSVPAHRAARLRSASGERDRAPDRRRPSARRVVRPSSSSNPCPAIRVGASSARGLWALEHLDEPLTVSAARASRRLQRADLRPSLPGRDGHHAAAVADRAAHASGPGDCSRPANSSSRGDRAQLRIRQRRVAARALPPGVRTTPTAYRAAWAQTSTT